MCVSPPPGAALARTPPGSAQGPSRGWLCRCPPQARPRYQAAPVLITKCCPEDFGQMVKTLERQKWPGKPDRACSGPLLCPQSLPRLGGSPGDLAPPPEPGPAPGAWSRPRLCCPSLCLVSGPLPEPRPTLQLCTAVTTAPLSAGRLCLTLPGVRAQGHSESSLPGLFCALCPDTRVASIQPSLPGSARCPCPPPQPPLQRDTRLRAMGCMTNPELLSLWTAVWLALPACPGFAG